MKRKSFLKFFAALIPAAALLLGMVGTASAAPPVSGAIFTTKVDGGVNINIYDSKQDVYLDGGPAHKNDATGLPNGPYFVRITSPMGVVLGVPPSDANGNFIPQVLVVGGKFVANGSFGGPVYQLWEILRKTGNVEGPGVAGNKGYDDTNNNGGEYKVWVSTEPGFPNDSTKTDNFKVRRRNPELCQEIINPVLVIKKYYDVNGDGIRNTDINGNFTENFEIVGWKVTIHDNRAGADTSGDIVRYTPVSIELDGGMPDTDAEGLYTGPVTGVTYTVTEATSVAPYDNWRSNSPNPVEVLLKSGYRVYDCDTGETLPGRCQDVLDGYVQFLNYVVATPGGHTLGFWSNKNGLSQVNAADFTLLTGLNLRNTNGSNRDFLGSLTQNRTDLNSWLLSANATNMANMLSVQLAATMLSIGEGYTSTVPSIIVDPVKNLDVLGLVAYANSLLANPIPLSAAPFNGLNGSVTVDSSALRTEQGRIKDILDKINNNGSFIQAPPGGPFAF